MSTGTQTTAEDLHVDSNHAQPQALANAAGTQ
jgi:hypothetical protein